MALTIKAYGRQLEISKSDIHHPGIWRNDPLRERIDGRLLAQARDRIGKKILGGIN
jgi:hypothetical protein